MVCYVPRFEAIIVCPETLKTFVMRCKKMSDFGQNFDNILPLPLPYYPLAWVANPTGTNNIKNVGI